MIQLFFAIQFAWSAQLQCQIYDLATAQVLEQAPLPLYSDKESKLKLNAIGVQAEVWDRPLANEGRFQVLKIDNRQGQAESLVYDYRLSDIGISPEKFPFVTSEIPGLGDTVQFYCR